jgi:hypothetical protein
MIGNFDFYPNGGIQQNSRDVEVMTSLAGDALIRDLYTCIKHLMTEKVSVNPLPMTALMH